MDVLGIDIGYGYTKSFSVTPGIQRKLLLPTAVSSYAPDISFGIEIRTIRVNGTRYAVGEEVIINRLPYEATTSEDFVGSPSYMAILGYVLSHTGFRGKVMVTGLPPVFFTGERADRLCQLIRDQWFADDYGKPIPIPETIKVIPQGSGIFFSHVVDHPLIFEKNVLVMDIGYYTLDIVFFAGGKYVEGTATSLPMGVKRVYDEIRRTFEKIHGTFPKDEESIEEIIKHGKYTHFGKEYQLDVRDIIDSYRNMINTTIKSYLGETVKKINYVLSGGGGTVFFQETMKGVIPVEDPQFANARGFYHYGRQFL
jgi:hypothetical protein